MSTLTEKARYDNVIWVFYILFIERLSCFKEVPTMRVSVTMQCTECRNRNYTTTKNKRKHPDRMELRKYCPRCNAHTVHRETK